MASGEPSSTWNKEEDTIDSKMTYFGAFFQFTIIFEFIINFDSWNHEQYIS